MPIAHGRHGKRAEALFDARVRDACLLDVDLLHVLFDRELLPGVDEILLRCVQ